jgi:integrase
MLGKLTDTKVKNAKAETSPYKLADGGGMYLLVTPKGQKWWRLDYRLHGRRQTLSLGVYPDVSLKAARKRRHEVREMVAAGNNPSVARRREKAIRANAHTFKAVANEWLGKHRPKWAPTHTAKIESRLKAYVFPWLGNTPVVDITAAELLRVLRRIEETGAHETAHRVRQHCGQVFRYAIATGRADSDVTYGLRGALAPTQVKHHASVTDPKAIALLLHAIDAYTGHFVTRCALKLAPLTFVRPGELRKAEWAEFDFKEAEWRIPAEKMKMGRPHIVPLSVQALEVLKDLQALTGTGRFLFPGVRTRVKPMSDATLTNALRNMGYSGDEMTVHGFRSMASTRLNEMGWHRDAIERQLAHIEGNEVRAAYNYAEHLPERRRMVQGWADYLDGLKNGAEVIPIHGVAV